MKLHHDSSLPFEELILSNKQKLIRFKLPAFGYPREEANRNVFLIDNCGQQVWRIAYHEAPHKSDPFHGNDPFVGFKVQPDGTIVGLTWDGWKFEINLADGTLKEAGWTKS